MPSRHSQQEQPGFFDKLDFRDPDMTGPRESVAALLRETPPVIGIERHGAGELDDAVKYVTLMEKYYAHGTTPTDQDELKKAQAIIIDVATVTIAGIKIERKKPGSMKEKAATQHREFVPSLDEWQSILNALPGRGQWHNSLKKILSIDIYEKSYWAWDISEGKMKIVRMSGHVHERNINPKVPDDADQRAHIRFIVRGD